MSALPAPDDSTARSRCRAVSDAARTRLALVTRSDGGSRRISRGAVALGPRERAHSCRGRCVASDLYASDSYASDLRASHLQRQICMGCALFFFVPSSSSLLLPAPPPSSSFGQRRVPSAALRTNPARAPVPLQLHVVAGCDHRGDLRAFGVGCCLLSSSGTPVTRVRQSYPCSCTIGEPDARI
jgi:hypothetical protein